MTRGRGDPKLETRGDHVPFSPFSKKLALALGLFLAHNSDEPI